MKYLLPISLIFLLFSSCKVGTNFSTRRDCFNAVDNMNYDEIVKVWGEPDYKSEVNVDDQNTVQQEAGAPHTFYINCIWGRKKVHIQNANCISINFDVDELPGPVFLTGRAKTFLDYDACNDSPNVNSNTGIISQNQYNVVSSKNTNSVKDSDKQISDHQALSEKADSSPLFRNPKRNEYLHTLIHKLPITYTYLNEKYIIYKTNDTLKVNCFLNDSLYNTFILAQNDLDLNFKGANALFQYDMAKGSMILAFPGEHPPKQLYISKTSNF